MYERIQVIFRHILVFTILFLKNADRPMLFKPSFLSLDIGDITPPCFQQIIVPLFEQAMGPRLNCYVSLDLDQVINKARKLTTKAFAFCNPVYLAYKSIGISKDGCQTQAICSGQVQAGGEMEAFTCSLSQPLQVGQDTLNANRPFSRLHRNLCQISLPFRRSSPYSDTIYNLGKYLRVIPSYTIRALSA